MDQHSKADRRARTQAVIEVYLRQRIAGDPVCDADLIAAHPELMPELGDALRKLAVIDGARRAAELTTTSPAADMRPVNAADRPEAAPTATSDGLGPARPVAARGGLPAADLFPGYRILHEIHRGGQGIVYQAIQQTTRRKVAIKVMKEGPFSGSADRARFEREVQILGALQHPNIVTIHDSGQARGLFYLVMDYIPGQALDEYASNSRLKLREVLGLFVKVCEAVNAAHLRGIIHRDLKPSNIRVDPDGEPHILDFGLAKLTPGSTSGLTQADMMTMTGQFIGSLPWASPEQAEGRPERIDLRTDVYSLGVILYQLLTGRFPYQVIGSMRDVLDNILSAVPARPSSVRRQIGDEVETIVLKCLNKERERRYQTAGELARDVRHYLNGEPIEAKRDSTWYVLRKLARRHAYTSTVAACLLVIIVSSGLLSFFFYQEKRAALERDQKRAAADNLVQSLYQERAEGVHAQVRRMALGWFLLEWHADRLASAERILGRTTRGAPEARVMTYLLEGVEDEAAFQAEMEAVRPGLGHFARGERLLKAGRSQDARAAFEECLDARPDDWLQALAEARLEQLAPLATGARE